MFVWSLLCPGTAGLGARASGAAFFKLNWLNWVGVDLRRFQWEPWGGWFSLFACGIEWMRAMITTRVRFHGNRMLHATRGEGYRDSLAPG